MILSEFNTTIYIWIGIAIFLFPIQMMITAPYGRHAHGKWGFSIDNRWGWILMEVVSPVCFGYFFLSGDNELSEPMWVFFALWMAHYINRSIVYPLRTKTSGKKIPLLVVLSAVFFNFVNGWTNGYMLGDIGPTYLSSWLISPQFIIGVVLFAAGMYINVSSDNYLISLRSQGDKGYSIPRGRLFEKVSCPNHFGEILEWLGFAIMCWNIAALAFAIWTAANLIPRAISHHKWYKSYFPNYPKHRKAVIPWVV